MKSEEYLQFAIYDLRATTRVRPYNDSEKIKVKSEEIWSCNDE